MTNAPAKLPVVCGSCGQVPERERWRRVEGLAMEVRSPASGRPGLVLGWYVDGEIRARRTWIIFGGNRGAQQYAEGLARRLGSQATDPHRLFEDWKARRLVIPSWVRTARNEEGYYEICGIWGGEPLAGADVHLPGPPLPEEPPVLPAYGAVARGRNGAEPSGAPAPERTAPQDAAWWTQQARALASAPEGDKRSFMGRAREAGFTWPRGAPGFVPLQ